MDSLESKIKSNYGEKLRVRVCGICITDEGLLMVHHTALGKGGSLWAPPGGGMEYGESAHEALKREFMEETHLDIDVERFLFVHEYLDPPLHGIELFFEVRITGGNLKKGTDPEMEANAQIITQVEFKSLPEIQQLPTAHLHYAIQKISNFESLLSRTGYLKNK
ncbi:NUDIX hydrolase [Roseivirga seohaensis subsp. aquiponti]|uniref:NUDIX hydrolase n=1 Tax=Roseivirga seohaensis subsp. aquiponti TaxID=1566026 RepID=A0A0L8AI47_9BACT|nr:NUDIX hydrolase [Roseivirga seohaensis]KOF01825.1 NUDIX hydrolase [Roseivirga seohaensis subsp. aquiponti]